YVELAASYLGTNQPENATQALQEGLRLDPKDPGLLKSMGSTYAAAGNAKLLQSDPKQPELKKQTDQLLQTILRSTTGVCNSCRGDGKFETLEEIEGG